MCAMSDAVGVYFVVLMAKVAADSDDEELPPDRIDCDLEEGTPMRCELNDLEITTSLSTTKIACVPPSQSTVALRV